MKKGHFTEWKCYRCKERFPATEQYFPLMKDNPKYFRNGHKQCALCLDTIRRDKVASAEAQHYDRIQRLRNFGRRIRERANEIKQRGDIW